MAIESRLFKKYNEEIKPALAKELNVKSIMQVPKIEKIVINMGLGKAVNNKKIVQDAVLELSKITGQQAIETYARVSNASFKIREGMALGVKVTLRGENMYNFLDKLITIALPRIRDFRGVNHKAFDGRGNYSLGVPEYIIFPEIDLDKVSTMKGMDIAIVTSASNNEDSYKLLEKFGMPFKNIKRGEQ
ncbi:MAG: 50S ribosomal protein L5 [Candidatus Tyloplasma litorale]|nr:MAG: 50S ribosomal protein L5 [Mycoplasmatales bacterium]